MIVVADASVQALLDNNVIEVIPRSFYAEHETVARRRVRATRVTGPRSHSLSPWMWAS